VKRTPANRRSASDSGRAGRPAADVDDYLSCLPTGVRAALEKLRRTIKATAPKAEEGISYRIPAYRWNGMLVGFAAAADHCTFHIMSTAVMRAKPKELATYDTGKGSIRFSADRPLPVALVRKLVKARLAENAP